MKRLALVLILIAAIAASGLAAFQHATRNPAGLGLRELGQTAGQAYIYGYPLVLMDETRRTMLAHDTGQAGPEFQINRLTSIRGWAQAGDETVVRPNLDTLYAVAWLDLSTGPVTLTVPDMGERYFVYQVMDAWTNVAAAPGTRTTGSGPDVFHIVQTGTPAPAEPGAVIEVPTRMAWIIGRIVATATAQDLDRVRALQDGFELSGPAPSGADIGPPGQLRPAGTVATLSTGAFFSRLDSLMDDNPAPARDAPMLATLTSLGIGPQAGSEPMSDRFGWLARWAIGKGVEAARIRLAGAIEQQSHGPANWRMTVEGMGDYGTDYALRAGVALVGLGANWPEDAVYPNTAIDSRGAPLNGAHAYRIHFEPGSLPPVRAFWSITLYDEEGFLPEIAGGRHAITDRDGLVYEPDGALVLVIAPQKPEGVPESNWLPAPDEDPFALTARLYWPKPQALSSDWTMPAVERLEPPS